MFFCKPPQLRRICYLRLVRFFLEILDRANFLELDLSYFNFNIFWSGVSGRGCYFSAGKKAIKKNWGWVQLWSGQPLQLPAVGSAAGLVRKALLPGSKVDFPQITEPLGCQFRGKMKGKGSASWKWLKVTEWLEENNNNNIPVFSFRLSFLNPGFPPLCMVRICDLVGGSFPQEGPEAIKLLVAAMRDKACSETTSRGWTGPECLKCRGPHGYVYNWWTTWMEYLCIRWN